jgi:hypothetical protein
MKHRSAWTTISLIFAVNSVALAYQSYLPASLPADTVMKIRMNNGISSKDSRPGDHFTASVEDQSLPRGTVINGVVTRAAQATKEAPGRITVDFQSLELPGGRRIPIEGSPIALDDNSVTTTSDGRVVAKVHSGSNIGKDIAIGAAGGLAIGSLLGSNVWGAIAGGGAGALFGSHHGHHYRDVRLKAGTQLGVRLDRPVMIARESVETRDPAGR